MCVEAEIKFSKSILLNLGDRPSNDHKELENYLKSSLSKWEISHTDIILAEDFNINLLDFDANEKVQNFVNLVFRFGMIPTVNKLTRFTKQTASTVHRIITSSIIHNGF